jgi:Protein of unknown function (DUF3604)
MPSLRLSAALLLACAACGPGSQGDEPTQAPTATGEPSGPRPVDDPDPPTANRAQAEQFVADLAAVRHPSDGGGSARLELAEGEVARVMSMAPGTWTVILTVGPLGIAEGGAVHFMPDPFWGWSSPQASRPDQPGYTEITTDAEDVEFEFQHISAGAGMTGALIAYLSAGSLEAGDEVRIVYGAGRLQARADLYADRGARLWVMVDGDGDGVRGVVEDSPTIAVGAAPAARLVLHGPSVAHPGDPIRYTVAVLDGWANVVEDVTGSLRLSQRPEGWGLPGEVELRAADRGALCFGGQAAGSGIARVAIEMELDGQVLRAEANPLVVLKDLPLVRWGDLHGHSNLSDGTGDPADWWRYARDVAGLDLAALTDHDHWGVRFLDQHPELWKLLTEEARRAHEPGRFVALLAYEWTSWIHGHRHVLHFADTGPLLSSLDPAHQNPRQLWEALAGLPVLTFAHHSAGDPVATNWSFVPPPQIEPVTEVMSVHGSSEAADSPSLIRGARRGNFVRDQLDRGLRLGLIGSGDGHDGHPGLAHLSPSYGWRAARPGEPSARVGRGGLAAILSEDLTRESVLEALRARRCYATSGPRILLNATLAGHPMGATIPAAELEEARLNLLILGTAGIEWIDLIGPERIDRIELGGERRFQEQLAPQDLKAGSYLYLRVHQVDGALAWSSPWFFE